jgi:hypothetical protein
LATALGILGTPTSFTSRLLGIPGRAQVETAYPDHSGEMDVLLGEIETPSSISSPSSGSSAEMETLHEEIEPLAEMTSP